MSFFQTSHKFDIENSWNIRLRFSQNQHNVVYMYTPDVENRLYAINMDSSPKCQSAKGTVVYNVRGVVVDVFSCFSRDMLLTNEGNIYRIPCNNKRTDANSILDAVIIAEAHSFFADKMCKAACSLGSISFAVLLYDVDIWKVKVYQVIKHSNKASLQRVFATNGLLRTPKSTVSQPVIVAFRAGQGNDAQVLPLNLMKSLVKNWSEVVTDSWLIIICVGDGNVFSVQYTESKRPDPDTKAVLTPLFCFHQEILSVTKVNFGEGDSSIEGLSFVGVLGKIILVIASQDDKATNTMYELYVPGSILCWSCDGDLALHSNDAALWLSNYKWKCEDGQSPNPTITSKQVSTEAVRALAIFNREGNGRCALVCTEAGHLAIFQLTELEESSNKYFRHAARDQSQRLNIVLQSSLKMAEIYQRQAHQKKLLDELSCASHLKFNQSLRQTFTCSLSSHWSKDSAEQIEICVSVKNTGQFAIVGNKWRFVATISNSQVSSISLLNGLDIGKNVEVSLKLHLNDMVTFDNFPITASCSLQFVYKVGSDECGDGCDKSAPIALIFDLAEWQINELYFLEPPFDSEPPKIKHSMSSALWEMADQRVNAGFHDLTRFRPGSNLSTDKPVELSLSVRDSRLQNLLKNESEECLLKKVLIYIVKNSRNIDLRNVNEELSASLFGVNLELKVAKKSSGVTRIIISTSSPALLVKLKHAIIGRLKLNENPESILAEGDSRQRFYIPSPVIEGCKRIESLVKECESVDESKRQKLIKSVYSEFRECLSLQLPVM